jgi:O-antigen/teichoic acid export membrane protein
MSKLIKNTALYTLGNLIPKAAAFFLLPLYTKVLTPADYGIISAVGLLGSICIILFSLAIDRSVCRLYWDHKTDETRARYLGSIIIPLWGISSVMLLLLLFPLRGVVSLAFTSIPFFPYYALAIIAAYLQVFGLIPKAVLRVRQQAGAFLWLSLAEFLITTGCVIWFILIRREGAAGMLQGLMAGPLVLAPVYIIYSFRIMHPALSLPVLRQSLRFSLPMIPVLLCSWVLSITDRIFIERYFSMSDVGLYSLGYRIAGLALVVCGAFYQAYNPLFYELASSDDQVTAKARLYKYNNAYVLFLLFICFTISFFSREVIGLFLDARYREAYKIVPIISLAYFISQTSGLLNLSVYQTKSTLPMMWVQIAAALANVGLNALMVPRFGAYGAAWATVLSFTVMVAVAYPMAKRRYFIPFNWPILLTGTGAAVLLVILFMLWPVTLWYSLLVKTGVVMAIGGVLCVKYNVIGEFRRMFAGTKIARSSGPCD